MHHRRRVGVRSVAYREGGWEGWIAAIHGVKMSSNIDREETPPVHDLARIPLTAAAMLESSLLESLAAAVAAASRMRSSAAAALTSSEGDAIAPFSHSSFPFYFLLLGAGAAAAAAAAAPLL